MPPQGSPPDLASILNPDNGPTGRSARDAYDLLVRSRVPTSAFKIDKKQALEILARSDLLAQNDYLDPAKIDRLTDSYKIGEQDPETLKRQAVIRMLSIPPSQRAAVAGQALARDIGEIEFRAMAIASSPFSRGDLDTLSEFDKRSTMKELENMGMTEQSLLNELNWPMASTRYGIAGLEELNRMASEVLEVRRTLTLRAVQANGGDISGGIATLEELLAGGGKAPKIVSVINEITGNDLRIINEQIAEQGKLKNSDQVNALKWKHSLAREAMNQGVIQNFNTVAAEAGIGGLQLFSSGGPNLETIYEAEQRMAIAQLQSRTSLAIAGASNALGYANLSLDREKLAVSSHFQQASLDESVLERLHKADDAMFKFVLEGGLGIANAKIAQRRRIEEAAAKGLLVGPDVEFVPGFEPGGPMQSVGDLVGVPMPNLRVKDYGTPVSLDQDAGDIQAAIQQAAQFLPQFRANPASSVQPMQMALPEPADSVESVESGGMAQQLPLGV